MVVKRATDGKDASRQMSSTHWSTAKYWQW